ncbi:Hsp20/alpha crystallin family protein [Litchfieldella xinjiangensis]|uniref:Hsp20/alpha crystallin family protein n=1 Tax=Litchfieldella xinjiangensis TaxID=1166948 RepID=UPI0005BE128B|nr:Hsp20/alpha crystallin family protein [Halomonas xinjiangensis]
MNQITPQTASHDVEATQARQGSVQVPPVDIYEEDNAVHIVVDMPGVRREGLSIEVDNNVLSLEGEIQVDMPEGISATYAELRAERYARRFSLSHEIDAEAIEARLEHGVLRLILPKKDVHRSRRIEVQAA